MTGNDRIENPHDYPKDKDYQITSPLLKDLIEETDRIQFCGQINDPHHWVLHPVNDSVIKEVQMCSNCNEILGEFLDAQISEHLIQLLIRHS